MIVGVDEAGRGCLAGPVVAAAVALAPSAAVYHDSKTLSHKRRQAMVMQLYQSDALAIGIGVCSAREIDQINILQASLKAMRRAMKQCERAAVGNPAIAQARIEQALIDGNRCPDYVANEQAIIGGDASESSIAAASIVAKEFRDQWLRMLDQTAPQYGFAKHKGYGTAAHLEALRAHGVHPEHRTTFAPVANVLSQPGLFA